MEDAHSFVMDFDNVRGQGFFAVFDGHAGKHAAEWCGNHFHEVNIPSFSQLIVSANDTASIFLEPFMQLPHFQFLTS